MAIVTEPLLDLPKLPAPSSYTGGEAVHELTEGLFKLSIPKLFRIEGQFSRCVDFLQEQKISREAKFNGHEAEAWSKWNRITLQLDTRRSTILAAIEAEEEAARARAAEAMRATQHTQEQQRLESYLINIRGCNPRAKAGLRRRARQPKGHNVRASHGWQPMQPAVPRSTLDQAFGQVGYSQQLPWLPPTTPVDGLESSGLPQQYQWPPYPAMEDLGDVDQYLNQIDFPQQHLWNPGPVIGDPAFDQSVLQNGVQQPALDVGGPIADNEHSYCEPEIGLTFGGGDQPASTYTAAPVPAGPSHIQIPLRPANRTGQHNVLTSALGQEYQLTTAGVCHSLQQPYTSQQGQVIPPPSPAQAGLPWYGLPTPPEDWYALQGPHMPAQCGHDVQPLSTPGHTVRPYNAADPDPVWQQDSNSGRKRRKPARK